MWMRIYIRNLTVTPFGYTRAELDPSSASNVAKHLASTASWPSLTADVGLRIYRTLKDDLKAGPVAEEYKKACAKVGDRLPYGIKAK